MGYDLRITRAFDWNANKGLEISANEWLRIVESDPELIPDPANGPYAVSFGGTRWLDWYEGNVFTTDPDHAAVNKMLSLARSLSAAVQGDEGEFYESASEWGRAHRQR
ncbi:MAG: hypothetical protein U1F36_16850 [Planctomycetota bacterium]